MKVALVSRDEDLCRSCRAALATLDKSSLLELIVDHAGAQVGADFYIWDYSPKLNLWALDGAGHHLVLVDRQDLPDAGCCLPPGLPLAIKPVPPAVLAGWMKRVYTCCRERGRQDFLAQGLHDFGTPLTAVSGYCELLLADAIDPLTVRQRAILDRMRNSLARLTRLRSEMFERTTGRYSAPNMRAASIEPCIDQAIHEIQILADKKHVTIAAEIVPPSERIYFDSGQVEQVCCNLLENACKFTEEGGRIEIRGYPWHARNCFRVDVFNTGPRILPEHLERIFDEYASFGSQGIGAHRGTGLGLAISRRIIERHGGRIWAENRRQGPAVSFVLPLSAPSVDRAPGAARHKTPEQSYHKRAAAVPA
jgi:Histidine kinase-, DNA gyrase B-, and HSP90-like ATPase/His Kinase A (phospho-acceptor) domain